MSTNVTEERRTSAISSFVSSLATAFYALKSRNYTLFFIGLSISRIGMWMQRTAVIWVVYELTNSLMMVAFVTFASQIPSLFFSPIGGSTSDRYPKKRIVVITQSVSCIQAAALAYVYFNGYATLSVIIALSLVLGIAFSFDIPARQALVNELIKDKRYLPSALSLNSTMNNLSRLIGPVFTAFFLTNNHAGYCFLWNAIGFAISLALLFFIRVDNPGKLASKKQGILSSLKDGFNYMMSERDIRTMVFLSCCLCMLVLSYITLQPYFADNYFSGADSFGYINAFTGAGALISTIYIATLGNNITVFKRQLFINLIILGVGLMVMSFVRSFYLYLALSVVCGFGAMSSIPIFNIVVQTLAKQEMRGRMISFLAMCSFGTMPLGSLLIGTVSEYVSPIYCQAAEGVICLIITALFAKSLLSRTSQEEKEEAELMEGRNAKDLVKE